MQGSALSMVLSMTTIEGILLRLLLTSTEAVTTDGDWSLTLSAASKFSRSFS